jgi:hypothetical protein
MEHGYSSCPRPACCRLACPQEPEADDRLGIAEAVGDVAANLAAAAGRELPGELPANPLLQRCFEALADPRPEVQDCAAASLGQVRLALSMPPAAWAKHADVPIAATAGCCFAIT